jgi:hypothetical protein
MAARRDLFVALPIAGGMIVAGGRTQPWAAIGHSRAPLHIFYRGLVRSYRGHSP